ncbi:MAG: hypothetical protein ACQEXG_01150 [Pseudomonadota bacterium]
MPPISRFVPSLLLTFCLALTGAASATNYNTGNVQAHGSWHSLTLSLGEERHFRAIEQQSYSDAIFSVNASAGACDMPWLELRVELDEYQAESRTVNLVPIDLRVDHETIHGGRAEFVTYRGDSGFYVHIYPEEQPLLLEEMRRGDILRLRMMRGEDDPWFMIFALDGAEAAISRAMHLCRMATP